MEVGLKIRRKKLSDCLAIIPARGGSKRIPKKNIKNFLSQPIIKYSIDAAINSSCFKEIMVSTDDKEIAEISISGGAKVPFLRSMQTSNDFATTADVLEEVFTEYKKRGVNFDYCCCIYPTAPFISGQRIIEGFNLLETSDADSVVPVVCFAYPIQRAFKIENGYLSMIWPENLKKRSQDFIPTYHDCGQFYWMRVERFLKNHSVFTNNSLAMILSEKEVEDIDNEEDWERAEMKFRINQQMRRHER